MSRTKDSTEYCEVCPAELRSDEELVSGLCKACILKYSGGRRKPARKKHRKGHYHSDNNRDNEI